MLNSSRVMFQTYREDVAVVVGIHSQIEQLSGGVEEGMAIP
jgi:hypothetical protein